MSIRHAISLWFSAAVLTLIAPHCLAGGSDSLSAQYKARYVSLYRTYVQNPDDVSALVALSDFYADSLNPMHNRALAMDYISKADVYFTALLQDGDRFREANRIVKQGVNISGIRQRRHNIAAGALAYLQTMPPLTPAEIERYAESFNRDPAIMQQLNQLKVDAAYRNATQYESADAYYTFFSNYGGTAEADTAETIVGRQAALLMQQAATEAEVDAIAARYPKSAIVQRAAMKRKGRIAYLDVCNRHTEQACRDYLSRYPSSDDYLAVLELMDTIITEDFYLMHRAQDYVDFILSHGDNPLAEQALQQLRRRIEQEHDTEAAELYLAHFPLDAEYNRLYQVYYGWHADEGNRGPVADFARRHPDYPYQEVLRNDRAQGVRIDAFDLMRPYSSAYEAEYASFLRMNTGKRIALVALQRMMQPALDGKRWKAALQTLQTYALSFESDGQAEYRQLKHIVETPGGMEPAIEAAPADNVRHLIPHPDGIHLYFNRDGRIYRAFGAGGAKRHWSEAAPLHFAHDANADLELFCLYGNGEKMLVGRDGDILTAHCVNGVWHLGAPLPGPVNTAYTETDAFMLPDESGLLLASDRPGGCNVQASHSLYHGDTALASDLYYIPCVDGQWGEPVHLGAAVNSPCCERHPLMSRNGTTLYFVSDRHGGLGYGDIYRTERLDDSWRHWSEPENMGREINSAHRESNLTFSPDESRLYFSSDRRNAATCYSAAVTHKRHRTDTLHRRDHNGVHPLDDVAFHTDGDTEYITWPGALDRLVHYLQEHPGQSVDILSHYQGRDSGQSYRVSLQRGEAVRRYLVKRGVERRRIQVSAYGNATTAGGTPLSARLLPPADR
ncbi:MAG: outer membrane protein/peptidoglycan-associated (lipo)protein [bacterium P3]|nr:MAG: outer membrane protein/peptidoglycan-associated (lipo)protein [bacterium P3]KWW40426.1 MAG: outer membrane protein/peptidoglycan-associated (lipo)protein [bacterium F083]